MNYMWMSLASGRCPGAAARQLLALHQFPLTPNGSRIDHLREAGSEEVSWKWFDARVTFCSTSCATRG